ncbi:MAG: glycine cleavage system protein H [Cryomorphaceae bacterium BACL18 MAG-120924-bin36]|jgi:glycine cleavage system H protein|nr:MAG: glycine cleavage system protein H [Cryomorphaceae bacterium BACL18 MAG-120924-bin36]KRP05604.1 MAG: glycine cleavage system protein H [Cryomorphaceae bacterium BACL18 MAG-120507-bin74]MDP4729557.1 glycine cleavage system protein GcvH [Schleiferiaceae bacterium]HAG34257.1 glycine cleavage system protein GcvH [Cryomorphaceae bacterium]MDP4833664.1 glycine cleavage system protein GcvH [Schleiferiaceae bacterium]
MEFPSNARYTKDHEWIRLDGDIATVGITDFAQGELGDIVFVDIPTEGETLAAEEVFGSVEAVKTVSDLYLPVAGEIVEVNAEIDGQPDLVNTDPYGAGWMVRIKVASVADVEALLDVDAYRALVGA